MLTIIQPSALNRGRMHLGHPLFTSLQNITCFLSSQLSPHPGRRPASTISIFIWHSQDIDVAVITHLNSSAVLVPWPGIAGAGLLALDLPVSTAHSATSGVQCCLFGDCKEVQKPHLCPFPSQQSPDSCCRPPLLPSAISPPA